MLQEYIGFIWVFYWKFLYINHFTTFLGHFTPFFHTFFSQISYLPTEFQVGSFKALYLYWRSVQSVRPSDLYWGADAVGQSVRPSVCPSVKGHSTLILFYWLLQTKLVLISGFKSESNWTTKNIKLINSNPIWLYHILILTLQTKLRNFHYFSKLVSSLPNLFVPS